MALATPEASLGTALGVAVLSYGVFQLHLAPMVDVRTCEAGNKDVASMAKSAAWTSAAAVAGVSLITKDATVFTIGGAVVIALYWMYAHANAVSPLTGKVHHDQMTVGDLMGAQGGAAPTNAANGGGQYNGMQFDPII